MFSSKAGFGLLSAMIAMVLLGIAVTALSSAGVYVIAMQTDSETRSQATAIAAAYLEEVKTREPTEVASESPTAVDSDGETDASGPFVRTLEVVEEENLEDTKRITVTVEYPSGRGRTRKVKLVTILYEGIYR